MVGGPNPSSAESSSWLIRSVTKEMGSRTQMQRNGSFNNNIKQRRTKTTPKGKNKQAGRRLEHSQTQNSHVTYDTRGLPDWSGFWSGIRGLLDRSGLWSRLRGLPDRSGLWSGAGSLHHGLQDHRAGFRWRKVGCPYRPHG